MWAVSFRWLCYLAFDKLVHRCWLILWSRWNLPVTSFFVKLDVPMRCGTICNQRHTGPVWTREWPKTENFLPHNHQKNESTSETMNTPWRKCAKKRNPTLLQQKGNSGSDRGSFTVNSWRKFATDATVRTLRRRPPNGVTRMMSMDGLPQSW